ncbi:hypothetical protein KAR91_59255 [Candidatus Pacearchaeota archaeon]|nr:hypothetical protein [Candidatus Pacearchaeota archaeon]
MNAIDQNKKRPRHAALLENSPRLQQVANLLGDKKTYSTREIRERCNKVEAVGSAVSELRDKKNGFVILCKQVTKSRYEYTMVGGFEQLFRLL